MLGEFSQGDSSHTYKRRIGGHPVNKPNRVYLFYTYTIVVETNYQLVEIGFPRYK